MLKVDVEVEVVQRALGYVWVPSASLLEQQKGDGGSIVPSGQSHNHQMMLSVRVTFSGRLCDPRRPSIKEASTLKR